MRYNFPIVYGPKTVFYDLSNCTDRKVVVSNRISLCILDMTEKFMCISMYPYVSCMSLVCICMLTRMTVCDSYVTSILLVVQTCDLLGLLVIFEKLSCPNYLTVRVINACCC